ncbi:MAG: methyl-accepting chemotaxis protein [archaeon]
MRLNDISIRWQLLIICVLLVSVPSIILGVISYNTIKAETEIQVEQNLILQNKIIMNNVRDYYDLSMKNLESNLATAEVIATKGVLTPRNYALDYQHKLKVNAVNQITKQSKQLDIPTMTVNDDSAYHDFIYVDRIKEAVGGTATIFQLIPDGLFRISTNVINEDGSRAVDTYIPTDSPVYKSIISGQTYYGNAFVVTAWYVAAYTPIRDSSGQVIGALYVGIPEKDFKEPVLQSLSEITVGKTGYLWILNEKGEYVLSLSRKRDGESIYDSQDSNGRKFVQEWLAKAPSMKHGEAVIDYYPWKNTGETHERLKIASYSYFPEWKWTVGSSIYMDDYYDNLNAIKNQTILTVIFFIVIGSFAAYLVALNIRKMLKPLSDVMKKLADGDLSARVDMHNVGKNEFGELACGINAMLDNTATPIKELSLVAKSITDGDLNVKVEVNAKGDMVVLVQAIRTMVESLRDFVVLVSKNANMAATSAEELSASAEEVNASTEQVNATIQELSKGGQNLATIAANTKQIVESVGMAARLVSESSKKATEGATKAGKIAQEGTDAGKKADLVMKNILESTQATTKNISQLDDKSKEIGKIIDVINSISEQTNLLALNAAIEAARAGDAGRGFAVVADEVRKLAEESKKATAQIAEMITSIQSGTKESVEDMSKASKVVQEGTAVVMSALASLEEISIISKDVGMQVLEVNAAAEQASVGIDQVNKSIHEVSAVAEESAAATEEVSASMEETGSSMQQVSSEAQNLAKGADELRHLLLRFKVNSDEEIPMPKPFPAKNAFPDDSHKLKKDKH